MNLTKIKTSNAEMNEIANRAKITFNITTEISILKAKAFKTLTGSSEAGGYYLYAQDRVLINRNVVELRSFPHIEWTIFHEFGHAYFARTLARNKFFPALVYGFTVEDNIAKAVRIIWNGLCDCFINELVLRKASLKKFDPTLEKTLDKLSQKETSGMCFHMYDYWKHGNDEQLAQKAKDRIPPHILSFLENKLSMTLLENPTNEMVGALTFIGDLMFQIKVNKKTLPKKELNLTTLPEFWGEENTELNVLEIV